MADLAARHARVGADVERRVLEVLRSGRYVGGPVVTEAERQLASLFGYRHGVGVNSGTDALIYALMAMGIQPGDEVVVPALTFFATAEAVGRLGAIPVVADVRADLPLLDPDALPLTARTRAVIAVHLFGEACPLPDLGVPILDDVAQAAGAAPPARAGAVGAASFYPTKTLGAAGDGGIVLADDPDLADRARKLASHGMPAPYVHDRVNGYFGANSRLDTIQAAVLLGHLADLDARLARRRAIAAAYDAGLPEAVRPLPRGPGHPVHHYVVRTPGRDALAAALTVAGIESAVYYRRPLSEEPALAGGPAAPTPNATRYCAEALALPVHEGLTDGDVDRVLDTIGRAHGSSPRGAAA
ncbi:MAG: aminotransferase class I/II-fold pyridoxal phosphate-dependent enzyme [Pseudomonadota bacterium]|nr:aminotransferase class I/II-fold pyridoxal phosphate-dependent enzyme [Pseudomonadota bacterium]